MNHYTYNIINKTNGKYYIGMRSTEVEPKNDIGVNYFGSSCNKEFKQALKEDKSNFIYKVIETYDSKEDAYKGEKRIHQKINVMKDPASYNLRVAGFMGGERLGIVMSEEQKQKISKSMPKRQKLQTCPKCGMSGGNNMKRYHFDKCDNHNGHLKQLWVESQVGV